MKDHYKMSTQLVEPDKSNEIQQPLFDRSMKENYMVPNMFKAMANHPQLLETYMNGYAQFRNSTLLTPAEQEVILLTVSRENDCNYCVSGHSMAADMMSNVPIPVTEAIRNGTEIPDEKLKQLSLFTAKMVNKRGNPSNEDAKAFLNAGYTENHMLAIILGIAIKTISNFSNHLFDTPIDEAFKSRTWKAN